MCRINIYGNNKVGIPDSKKYLGKLDSLGTAHLTITNIQPIDSTNYTCLVETTNNEKLYKSTNILVRRKLRVMLAVFPR